MVSPTPNLRRSPRSGVKGGSSSAPTSAGTASASTSGSSVAWGHHHHHHGVASNVQKTSSTRGGTFFSSGSLDAALVMSQHQPSTSQAAGLSTVGETSATMSNPTVKLNKSILTSSALAANTDNVANVVGLIHGAVAGASSSGSSLQVGFGGQSAGQAAADVDTEDPDVGRLQALLEARGIPPHVFGSLGEFLGLDIGGASELKRD